MLRPAAAVSPFARLQDLSPAAHKAADELVRSLPYQRSASKTAPMRLRRKEPTGLGSEYERLVRGPGGTPRERRAIALQATRFTFRLLSWIVTVLVILAAFIFSFGLADIFLSGGWSLLIAFAVVAWYLWRLRRSWRRYRAPLIRFIPRFEYQRFSEWQAAERLREPDGALRRWKLDLRVIKRVNRT